MCKPASLIITKERVFWSAKTDSHEDIIREFDLKDEVAERITLVRVEITPPGDDMRLPLDQWQFRLDQDLLPEWYEKNPEKHQGRAMDALQDWHNAKVFLSGRHEIHDGQAYACGSSQVTARDSSQVTARDSSQVTAYDSNTVRACGSSNGVIYSCKLIDVQGNAALVDRRGLKIALLTAE